MLYEGDTMLSFPVRTPFSFLFVSASLSRVPDPDDPNMDQTLNPKP